jgi:putative ABC transport system permease protein
MKAWLQDFNYRTSLAWTMFVTAGGLCLLLAIITVGFQAIKAATENPVKSLRSE